MKEKSSPQKKLISPHAALAAKEKGLLEQWVQEYLHGEGNYGLAAALKRHQALVIDIIEFPLKKLKKIKGPESVQDRESLDIWEERVSIIELLIKKGHALPPLIVTDFWRSLEIADGNHRHEAFIRNGIKKYWTIFFIRNESNISLLEKHQTEKE